jgi:DNA-binding MarR family transcriptional regulator
MDMRHYGLQPLFSTMLRRLHLNVRREIYAAVAEAGHDQLTPAHLYVFQSPGPDGLRPTELAEQMNMTKQATNHLLVALERLGYITRESSAEDGRARVLRATAKGREVARIMQQTSRRMERRWAQEIGAERVERLRAELEALDTAASERVKTN